VDLSDQRVSLCKLVIYLLDDLLNAELSLYHLSMDIGSAAVNFLQLKINTKIHCQ